MRHGRGTDFASLGALLEKAERDVTPDIAIQVDQNRIGARDRIEQFSHVIVRFDLDRVRIEGQSQMLLDHIFGECRPVEIGISGQMRIVIADRAVHLAQDFDCGDALFRALQPRHHIRHFLAERGRAGWLAMRARHHREVGILMRQYRQLLDHALQRRQQYRVARRLQHHAVRCVVDVFRCACEMNEFRRGDQFRHILDLFLQPVFDRLHIVIGDRFDRLDAFRIAFGEVGRQFVEQRRGESRERLDFGEACGRQRLQPRNFHFDAVMHESCFGQDRAQFVGLGSIAAVQRGKGGKCGKRHDKQAVGVDKGTCRERRN